MTSTSELCNDLGYSLKYNGGCGQQEMNIIQVHDGSSSDSLIFPLVDSW